MEMMKPVAARSRSRPQEDAGLSLRRERRTAPTAAQAQAEGTLLLLVDDHPTTRMILVRQAGLLGYAAEVAENGIEALAKWRTGRFAMVITDCDMPHMDGYELAKEIRAEEGRGDKGRCVVVAYTAFAEAGETDKWLAAGMDDCLSKPTDLNLLEGKLHRWLPIPAATATDARPARDKDIETIPPPRDDRAPIDFDVLAEVCTGDAAAVRVFLAYFWSSNQEDVKALERAMADRDLPEVARASHRMRGAGRTVGATAMADVCETIERAARANKSFSEIAPSMVLLDQELDRLDRFLEGLPKDGEERASP